MLLSKWTISPKGKFSRIEFITSSSPIRIVYLDDHKLFRDAVINSCIKPFFKNIAILEFENGDDAYEFIKKEINGKNKIDLIITDINHPGLRGQELVKSIRIVEAIASKKSRIPIILLSMVAESYYPELLNNKMVNYFLSKATESEDIIDCMEEILFD